MKRGFTVIELIVAIALVGVGVWLFFSERASINSIERDLERKTSINAIYYSLEESYYPAHQYYPSVINSEVLRTMDPELFYDPAGIKLGEPGSDFRYDPVDCTTDGKCAGYTLHSYLEKESEYTKSNRSHNSK